MDTSALKAVVMDGISTLVAEPYSGVLRAFLANPKLLDSIDLRGTHQRSGCKCQFAYDEWDDDEPSRLDMEDRNCPYIELLYALRNMPHTSAYLQLFVRDVRDLHEEHATALGWNPTDAGFETFYDEPWKAKGLLRNPFGSYYDQPMDQDPVPDLDEHPAVTQWLDDEMS